MKAFIEISDNTLKQSIEIIMPNGDQYEISVYHDKSELQITDNSMAGRMTIYPNISNQIIIKTIKT